MCLSIESVLIQFRDFRPSSITNCSENGQALQNSKTGSTHKLQTIRNVNSWNKNSKEACSKSVTSKWLQYALAWPRHIARRFSIIIIHRWSRDKVLVWCTTRRVVVLGSESACPARPNLLNTIDRSWMLMSCDSIIICLIYVHQDILAEHRLWWHPRY